MHVIGDRAAGAGIRIDFTFTDTGQTWAMRVRRGVLNARRGAGGDARLTVSGPKKALVAVLLKPGSAAKLAEAGEAASPCSSPLRG